MMQTNDPKQLVTLRLSNIPGAQYIIGYERPETDLHFTGRIVQAYDGAQRPLLIECLTKTSATTYLQIAGTNTFTIVENRLTTHHHLVDAAQLLEFHELVSFFDEGTNETRLFVKASLVGGGGDFLIEIKSPYLEA